MAAVVYTEKELANAIEALWEKLKPFISEKEQEEMKQLHPVVDEVDEFGATGPVGIGLGRYGGHAVG